MAGVYGLIFHSLSLSVSGMSRRSDAGENV